MTERYKLELYLIRENELEFALYDKEAETSQGTIKMVEKKLNRQDKRIKALFKENEHLKQKISLCEKAVTDDINYSEMNKRLNEILFPE